MALLDDVTPKVSDLKMSGVAYCPACGGSLENDPRLSGQVVDCPYCGIPFQMPYAIAIASPAQAPQALVGPAPDPLPVPLPSLSGKRFFRRRRTGAIPKMVAWGGFFVGGLLGVYCGLAILRYTSPAALETVLSSVPFLRPLAERLP